MFYLDFIRAIALISILIIHFNATVTGYFTLPNRLLFNTLPFGIYLGDFGSSLFFLVSGAALALTYKEGQPLWQFYKKRAAGVFPLFWLAWSVEFALRFLQNPAQYRSVKTATLLFTVLGIDQFAVAAGWTVQDFACVGEWFLGTLLFLYALYPLLHRGLKRSVGLCGAVVCALCLVVHRLGWLNGLVAIHIPEFLFGMAFAMLGQRTKLVLLPLLAVGGAWTAGWDTKVGCALFSMAAYLLLAFAAPLFDSPWLRVVCGRLAALSYPIFLLHHVLILRMVQGMDLAALTQRDTAFLFLFYLAAVFLSAEALLWLQHVLRSRWLALGRDAASQQG